MKQCLGIISLFWISLIYLIFACDVCAQSQSDSLKKVVELEAVTITGNPINDSLQLFRKIFETNIKLNSLDEGSISKILELNPSFYLKFSGSSGLATPSFRGTTANQSLILWNDFPITSFQNGTLDLNLIPNFFIDDIQINLTGNDEDSGFNGVGCIINLKNSGKLMNDTIQKLTARLGIGSFGFNEYGMKYKHSTVKNNCSLGIFHSTTQNNFRYRDFSSNKDKYLNLLNSDFHQTGIQYNHSLKLFRKYQLEGNFQYLKTARGVPPTYFVPSVARQYDESLKLVLSCKKINDDQLNGTYSHKNTSSKLNFYAKGGFFHDFLRYVDPKSLLDVCYYNYTTGIFTGFQKRTSKQDINLDLQWIGTKSTNEIWGNKYQIRTSIRGNWNQKLINRLNWKTWAGLSLKIELYNLDFAGILNYYSPVFKIENVFFKRLGISMQMGRQYRAPTLNDLFWIPGGNPYLKPENCISFDGGFKYNTIKFRNFFSELGIQFYQKSIQELILWTPFSGLWSPINISKVMSRGYESRLAISYQTKKISLQASGKYHFIRSINQNTNINASSEIGKQLIYTPVHSLSNNISLIYKGFTIRLNLSYYSIRYTTSDNTQFLPAYYVLNSECSKSFHIKKQEISLKFLWNNITGVDYQTVESRPMPPANFQFYIEWNLTDK